MEDKRKQWQSLGRLKNPKKSLDMTFWRFIILINWSWKGWDSLVHNGTLRWYLFSIHSFSQIGKDGNVRTGCSLLILFLSISVGFIRK